MNRKYMATGLALSVLAMTGCGVANSKIEYTDTLNLQYTTKKLTLEPENRVWNHIPRFKLALTPQKMVVPHGGGSVTALEIQALHNGKQVAFKVQWNDNSQDLENGVDTYKDAVAIQFPTKISDTAPSPFMGDPQNPVNIWQWRSDWQARTEGKDAMEERQPVPDGYIHRPDSQESTSRHAPDANALEFVASGWGTLTRQKKQDIQASGVYQEGRWEVVFLRDLVRSEESDAIFTPGQQTHINFAVWNGQAGEVNGMKSISMAWVPLPIAPGE